MNLVQISILARARAEILQMRGYSSARMEARRAAVMLNANESPWPPGGSDDTMLNRYPEPQPTILLMQLAALYGVDAKQILTGRGSDEAIDLLVRAFCSDGRDAVVVSEPTFGMYGVAAQTQGAQVISAPLDASFALDVPDLLAKITPAVKIVFVCTPNNPTGSLVSLAKIEQLASALEERALVVVDEAYLEFAQGTTSATCLLARFENLVVLRTLSKAHALAGARIGSVIAHAQIIALLRKIQAPYPLPILCVQAALRALTPAALSQTRARIALVLRQRDRIALALQARGNVTQVLPSHANFICARFIAPQKVYKRLYDSGIVVRDVSHYAGLSDCLRITVGTPQENDRLLAVLAAREVPT